MNRRYSPAPQTATFNELANPDGYHPNYDAGQINNIRMVKVWECQANKDSLCEHAIDISQNFAAVQEFKKVALDLSEVHLAEVAETSALKNKVG